MRQKSGKGWATSAAAFDLIAARFRILSEASRLRLLAALEGGERNVSQLVEATQLTQANVSRHLAVLADGGIVSRRREGLNVFYRIADPAIFELCHHVCGSLRHRLEEHARALS